MKASNMFLKVTDEASMLVLIHMVAFDDSMRHDMNQLYSMDKENNKIRK